MPKYSIPVLFDVDSVPPVPLGTFERYDEEADVVIYTTPHGTYALVPHDCIQVITVEIDLPGPSRDVLEQELRLVRERLRQAVSYGYLADGRVIDRLKLRLEELSSALREDPSTLTPDDVIDTLEWGE